MIRDRQRARRRPWVAGRNWRAKIGIVLQEVSDAGMLTVSETARMFAKCYGAARSPRRYSNSSGSARYPNRKCGTLSGGQRRRLDVALGIINLPELLFLDEPTTGFDPEARLHFWDLIRLLASAGTTILLTTHYLEEAAALADRVAVIADGQVVAVDSPQNLIRYVSSAATVRWRADGEIHDSGNRSPDRTDQGTVDGRCGVD